MNIIRAILLVSIMYSGCLTLHAQAVNGIKAVVHNSVISFYQVENLTAPAADALLREYRTQPDVYQRRISEALNDSLDQLINRQLILHEFETAGYNLPESAIDEIVEERIRSSHSDRATLTKSLMARGIRYEKFRQQLRDQFIIEQMRVKNVSSEIMVSPHKIEVYYAEHKAEYHVEDQVKLRMIVLNKPAGGDGAQEKQLATEVLSKIKAGAAFADMASLYSQGSQRSQGGDWGWVERSVLREELADVAFSLKPGNLSDVIDIPGAYYVMQVEEAKPAHYKPLSEMRDDIERTLLDQENARLVNQWIGRLKKKTFVRFF